MTLLSSLAAVSRDHCLVLPEPVLQQLVHMLAADPTQIAAGVVRLRTTPTSREYLLEQVEASAGTPPIQARAALETWCLVTGVSPGTVPEPLHQVVARAGRAAGQRVVAVRLDCRRRGWWEGTVFDELGAFPVTQIRAVGGGLLVLERGRDSASDLGPTSPPSTATGGSGATEQQASLSGEESRGAAGAAGERLVDGATERSTGRDSRTRGALGARVAERLRRATVTLVGAGRNGTQLAQQLASLGIGRLRILDPDTLHPENLDGVVGLAAADVGRLKVEALARSLHAYRPELPLVLAPRSTRERGGTEFLAERSDLLVTCVDDDLPRVLVALAARQSLTPHLDVGTRVVREGAGLQLAGDARLLLPGRGCVLCVGGVADLPGVLRDLRLPAGALLTRSRRPWHIQRAGSLVTINALAVGAGVQLWLDLAAGGLGQSYWQRLAWQPGAGLQADGGGVSAEPGCVLCERGQLPDGKGAESRRLVR
jgi:molybdopterin/thiamine biosynthesis adenylyltransferase